MFAQRRDFGRIRHRFVRIYIYRFHFSFLSHRSVMVYGLHILYMTHTHTRDVCIFSPFIKLHAGRATHDAYLLLLLCTEPKITYASHDP